MPVIGLAGFIVSVIALLWRKAELRRCKYCGGAGELVEWRECPGCAGKGYSLVHLCGADEPATKDNLYYAGCHVCGGRGWRHAVTGEDLAGEPSYVRGEGRIVVKREICRECKGQGKVRV